MLVEVDAMVYGSLSIYKLPEEDNSKNKIFSWVTCSDKVSPQGSRESNTIVNY